MCHSVLKTQWVTVFHHVGGYVDDFTESAIIVSSYLWAELCNLSRLLKDLMKYVYRQISNIIHSLVRNKLAAPTTSVGLISEIP